MDRLPPAIATACANVPELGLSPGAELIVEGAPGGRLFVLIEGSVKVLRANVEVASIDESGAVFGEMSLLLGVPFTATVTTVDASRFYVIEDGNAFLRSNPDVMLHVSKTLAMRVHLLTGYLADLRTQFADQEGHLGMVHEIMCGLCEHPHADEIKLGWDRQPDSGS